MTKEKYLETQMIILNIGRSLQTVDLDGFLSQISKAETVGPILDPTMYRKVQDNLQAIKKLAQTLQLVKGAFGEVFAAVVETAVRGDMEPSKKDSPLV